MASTIASSKSMLEPLRSWLVAVVALLPVLALAVEIEIANPQITASEDGFVVSADFGFDLNERLEEAVSRGVVLYFVTEFEMTRPRWYWLDEKVVSRSQTQRLSYHALTRQYRLSRGGLHQSFDTLSEALRVLSRLRNWLVIDGRGEKAGVQAGDTYMAALRMRLDINQLPRPFQISALGNRDWNLASDWKVWQATLPVEAR
ncbi:MAG: DUF4390 domain-containing protein [Dechloromonas sp.]|nr:MAG: DUF4390 domain-containing protein [Dechloromonas sp.]